MSKPRNPRFIVGPLLIVGALGLLVTKGMQSSTLNMLPVSLLRAKDNSPESRIGQRLRVAGFVSKTPVRKTPVQTPHGQVQVNHFNMEEAGKVIAVEYRDALPDTFQAGGPVQVDGEYFAAGKMRADHVFTKCPSKYEGGEKALKKGKDAPYSTEPEARPNRQAQSQVVPAKPSL